MHQVRTPYLSLVNFVLFALFCACLWVLCVDVKVVAKSGLTRVEFEMLLLQLVSMLLLVGAFQMPHRNHRFWRWSLVGMSFIALAQSCLLAFLSPVA